MQNRRTTNRKGFTLIEVLVALVILAVALTAIIQVTHQNIRNTQGIVNRTVAHWVALNILADFRTGLLPLPTGQPSSGKSEMLNRHWYWTATASASNNPTILEIVVNVSDQPQSEKSLVHLIDFIRVNDT